MNPLAELHSMNVTPGIIEYKAVGILGKKNKKAIYDLVAAFGKCSILNVDIPNDNNLQVTPQIAIVGAEAAGEDLQQTIENINTLSSQELLDKRMKILFVFAVIDQLKQALPNDNKINQEYTQLADGLTMLNTEIKKRLS